MPFQRVFEAHLFYDLHIRSLSCMVSSCRRVLIRSADGRTSEPVSVINREGRLLAKMQRQFTMRLQWVDKCAVVKAN